MVKDASENAAEEKFVGTSKHFQEVNIHPKQKLDKHNSGADRAAEVITPQQEEARAKLARFFEGMFAALKEFEQKNKPELSFNGFRILKREEGKVEIHLPSDKPLLEELYKRPVDDEDDVFYKSLGLSSPLVGKLVKDGDNITLKQITGGRDARGKDIIGGVSHLVAHRLFRDWDVDSRLVDLASSNNALLISYIHPLTKQLKTRQIWPPKAPRNPAGAPAIDENTIARE